MKWAILLLVNVVWLDGCYLPPPNTAYRVCVNEECDQVSQPVTPGQVRSTFEYFSEYHPPSFDKKDCEAGFSSSTNAQVVAGYHGHTKSRAVANLNSFVDCGVINLGTREKVDRQNRYQHNIPQYYPGQNWQW